MHLDLALVYIPIKMYLALAMAYIIIKMHLAPNVLFETLVMVYGYGLCSFQNTPCP